MQACLLNNPWIICNFYKDNSICGFLRPITMKVPPFLEKGDKIGIVAPASHLGMDLSAAVEIFNSWGLEVVLGKSTSAEWHQFAGDDHLRTADFQLFLDDPEIKAIVAARGGYGTVRIIDRLNFSKFMQSPKWIVGFSDVTVLHAHLHANFGIATLHAQMPLNLNTATLPSLQSMRNSLFGPPPDFSYASRLRTKSGEGKGLLTGGNLSVLVSLLRSPSELDCTGKILFLEDVGEYYYAIDRMFYTLKRAGILSGLAGLVLGGFTGLKDKAIPFGSGVEEMVLDLVREYDFPVASDFPAGHIDNNQALILGKEVNLLVKNENIHLKYI